MLGGVPDTLFAATPTRLNTWVGCPRRYRFNYLDHRPKAAPWAHNSVGTAAHNALRDWWSEPVERRTSDVAVELVTKNWLPLGFRDREQSQLWQNRTADSVAAYVAGLDPMAEPVGIERTVAATTSRLALSGRIDRVDQRGSEDGGEELVVVDYKTGRRPSTEQEARTSLALAVYVAGVRRTFRRRSRRVELHHLPSGTVAAFEHTEASLARQLARADDIGAEASAAQEQWKQHLSGLAGDASAGVMAAVDAIDEAFPPRPSHTCAWCDFRSSCPEGQASSNELEPWAALSERVS